MDFSHIHLADFFSGGTLLVALAIYRKLTIMSYQHRLMWTDYAERKNISALGKAE